RRDKVDVVTAACLQLEHHLGQAFVRNLVLDLLFVSLRNLVVLAIDATQITVAEEDVSRAACAGQRRLFAKVRSVGRNDRQASRVAARKLILQTIIAAIEWTDGAAREQLFESFYAMRQLT